MLKMQSLGNKPKVQSRQVSCRVEADKSKLQVIVGWCRFKKVIVGRDDLALG